MKKYKFLSVITTAALASLSVPLAAYNLGANSHTVLDGYNSSFNSNPARLQTWRKNKGSLLGFGAQAGHASEGPNSLNLAGVPLYAAIGAGKNTTIGLSAEVAGGQAKQKVSFFGTSFETKLTTAGGAGGLGVAHSFKNLTVGLNAQVMHMKVSTEIDGLPGPDSDFTGLLPRAGAVYSLKDLELNLALTPGMINLDGNSSLNGEFGVTTGAGYHFSEKFMLGAEAAFANVGGGQSTSDGMAFGGITRFNSGLLGLNGRVGFTSPDVGNGYLDVGAGFDLNFSFGTLGIAAGAALDDIPLYTARMTYTQLF